MQVFLRLLLFFALLTIGASLECEVCFSSRNNTSNSTSKGTRKSPGFNCHGPTETCAANKDTCMVAIAEHNLEGVTEHITERSCAFSKVCNIGKVHLFVGKGRTYRSSIVCCKGKDCPKDPPPIPPEETTPSGKECPACFAWSKTCQAETVKCTGSDTHCIDVSTTHKISPDGKLIDSVLKGCTTKAVCASIKQEKTPLLMGEVEKVLCDPEVSRGSQLTSFLLPTFSGLLLMKIFG